MKEKSDQNESHVPNDLISRSDEVQEVLGHVPHWIVRWGITIIAVISLFFIIGSYFFRYQEKISAEISIVSIPPTVYISSPVTGTIDEVFVCNGEKVKQNQQIAKICTNHDTDNIVIQSPIDGTIYFVSDCYNISTITEGSQLFVITPDFIEANTGILHLSSEDANKIKKGMTVRLHSIDNQAGYFSINSVIKSISAFPNAEGKYIVELTIPPQAQITQYLTRNSQFPVEIIVNKQRLIEKIIAPIKSNFYHESQ